MKPGPAPTPSAVLKLRGSHRAKTGREFEPKPKYQRKFKAAKWMNEKTVKLFRNICDRLKPAGVMTAIDRDALVAYAYTWSMFEESAEWVSKHGQMQPIKDDNGVVVELRPWPQVKIVKDLLPILLRYQQEFGMTPSSRTRVSVDKSNSPVKDNDGQKSLLRLG